MTSTLGKKTLTNLYADQAQQLQEQSASYGKMKAALKTKGKEQQASLDIAIADLKHFDKELHDINEEIHLAEVRKQQNKFTKVPNVNSFEQWKRLYGGNEQGASDELSRSSTFGRTRSSMKSSQLLTIKAEEELVKVKNRISRIPNHKMKKAPELTNMDQWRELYGK